jgi:hypothetical protein
MAEYAKQVQKCCKDNYEDHLPALHSFLMDYLTPWSTVPSEMLIVRQLVKTIYTLYGTQDFIIASQEPATVLYSGPNKSSPQPPILFHKERFH